VIEPTIDVKLSEFLSGMSAKNTSSTAVAEKTAKKATALEVTQDLAKGDTTVDLSQAVRQATEVRGRRSEVGGQRSEVGRRSLVPAYAARNRLLLVVVGCLAGLAIAAAGIVLFLPAGNGTIRVEINDPSIEVTVSQTGYKITGKSEEIHLKPGEHTLHVKAGELEFDTNKFVLGKGENPALRVELLPGKIQVVRADGKMLGSATRPKEVATTQAAAGRQRWMLELNAHNSGCVVRDLPLPPQGPMTLEAWVKPGKVDETGHLFSFYPSLNVTYTSNDEWYVQARTAEGYQISRRVPHPASDGLVHIAGVLKDKEIRLYIAGQLAASMTLPSAPYQKEGQMACSIGRGPDNRRLPGLYAEIRISKVARYHDAFIPQVKFESDEQTVALFHCDEGAGNILVDATPSRHIASLTGARWARHHLPGATTGLPNATASGGTINRGLPGDNWIDLFNGRDLTGWIEKGHGGWSVKEGVLVGESAVGMGWLMSQREFDHFELELEYKLPAGGNSGIFLRAAEAGAISGSEFHEIQLLDVMSPKFADVRPEGRTGALFGKLAPTKNTVAGANVWHRVRVKVFGDRLQVSLNGSDVLNGALPAGKPSQGHIGLQLYSPGVSFRNIRISELNPDGRAMGVTAGSSSSASHAASPSRISPTAGSSSSPAPAVNQTARTVALDLSPATDEGSALVEIPSIHLGEVGTIEVYTTPRVAEPPSNHGHIFQTIGRFALKRVGTDWLFTAGHPDGRAGETATAKDGAQPGKRVHLAAVFTPKELRLFVEGHLADAKSYIGSPWQQTPACVLGARVARTPFQGTIDEFRISRTARYAKDFLPPPIFDADSDTVLLYHFNEGQGETLTDSSGNGHHGQIVGATWVSLNEPSAASRRP
jgi:hypothetical protein